MAGLGEAGGVQTALLQFCATVADGRVRRRRPPPPPPLETFPPRLEVLIAAFKRTLSGGCAGGPLHGVRGRREQWRDRRRRGGARGDGPASRPRCSPGRAAPAHGPLILTTAQGKAMQCGPPVLFSDDGLVAELSFVHGGPRVGF